MALRRTGMRLMSVAGIGRRMDRSERTMGASLAPQSLSAPETMAAPSRSVVRLSVTTTSPFARPASISTSPGARDRLSLGEAERLGAAVDLRAQHDGFRPGGGHS
ncbi:MAG: hypothetical protein ACREXX_02145 [Gammaproteobacteria bacterium]